MKIMILGGDGFIGSHLRDKHIELGDDVLVIDKNVLRFRKIDEHCYTYLIELMDESEWYSFTKIFKQFDPDFVYNCIAVANPDFYIKEPILTFEIDFNLNKKIIDFLVSNRTPFLHFSTSEVYGKIQNDKEYIEKESNLILGPTHKVRWIYATSKILLEQLILSYINMFKIEACIVRPFNFIGYDIDWIPSLKMGGNEWKPRVYSCFMDNLINNENLQIVYPGTQKRCYCYIDDAIDGLISILNNWDNCKGKVLNIGNPDNETNIIRLARRMIDKYNKITVNEFNKGIILVDGQNFYGIGYEDSERRMPNVDLIKKSTGWESKTSLDEMLEKSMIKTLEWIKNL